MCMEISLSKKIREGLIKFGVDGVSTSQGAKSGVNVHVIKKNGDCPLHCISHQSRCPNPFQFKVVRHVKGLLATLYSYFNSFLQMRP